MNYIINYTKHIPYLYFIAVCFYWFTDINKNNGLIAYPILLFGIPFLWQLIKPNKTLNLVLGFTFICVSSYLILAYLGDIFKIFNITENSKSFILYGGLFVVSNFVMALWIIKNSISNRF